jgi:hypothetical protein
MAMGIQDLLTIGLTFVVVGITIAYGLDIMLDVQGDVSGEAQTAVNNSITAVGNISEKSGTLTTVIMAGLVIGVLLSSFYFSRR